MLLIISKISVVSRQVRFTFEEHKEQIKLSYAFGQKKAGKPIIKIDFPTWVERSGEISNFFIPDIAMWEQYQAEF